MGHFTVPCGLSGVPINGGDEVIGFNVEFLAHETYHNYVPTCIPVIGEYDSYGRLENKSTVLEGHINSEKLLVLCHKELWDIAAFGHDKPYTGWQNQKYVTLKEYSTLSIDAHKKMIETINNVKNNKNVDLLKGKDLVSIFSIRQNLHNEYVGPHMFLKRMLSKELLNEWEENIEQGKHFTDEEYNILSQTARVYQDIFIRGRQITPTFHCFTIQDTDYKSEAKWHASVAKFARSRTKRK